MTVYFVSESKPLAWPFGLNPASPQYRGLLYCGVCTQRGVWIDLLKGDLGVVDTALASRNTRYGPEITNNETDNAEITFGSTTYLSISSPWTICFQVYCDDDTNDVAPFSIKTDAPEPLGCFYFANASYEDFSFGSGIAGANFINQKVALPAGIASTGVPHWIVYRFKGVGATAASNFSCMVNGLDATLSNANNFSTNSNVNKLLTLGSGGSSFNGAIRQLRIYNYRISDTIAKAFSLTARDDLFRRQDPIPQWFTAAGGTILPTINGVVNPSSINGVINAVSINGVVST